MLSHGQRLILLIVGLVLASLLFFFRGGLYQQAPLDQLARRSLEPENALQNGRPTIFEFYADWCEACREMAPSFLDLEHQMENKLDIVLLNVDNPIWNDLIDEYNVKGIPQLNLFDKTGNPVGVVLGARKFEELQFIVKALVNDDVLPDLSGLNLYSDRSKFSSITNNESIKINYSGSSPRSHG